MIFSEDDAWKSIETVDGRAKKCVKENVFILKKLSNMSAQKTTRTIVCGKWDGQTRIK